MRASVSRFMRLEVRDNRFRDHQFEQAPGFVVTNADVPLQIPFLVENGPFNNTVILGTERLVKVRKQVFQCLDSDG